MCSGGEGGGGKGGGVVGHVGIGIILSSSCLPLTLFYFMFILSFYCFSLWYRN